MILVFKLITMTYFYFVGEEDEADMKQIESSPTSSHSERDSPVSKTSFSRKQLASKKYSSDDTSKMALIESSSRKQENKLMIKKEDREESNSENSDFDENMKDEDKPKVKNFENTRRFNEDDREENKQVKHLMTYIMLFKIEIFHDKIIIH